MLFVNVDHVWIGLNYSCHPSHTIVRYTYNSPPIVCLLYIHGIVLQVPVKDYLKLVESFRPTAFESLCDSVSSVGNRPKRIRKSVDRTVKFLDETLAARTHSKVGQ